MSLCSNLQVRKKDQINIETKNKTVRFIGELTKFKMFTKNDTLHCLKVCAESFEIFLIEKFVLLINAEKMIKLRNI